MNNKKFFFIIILTLLFLPMLSKQVLAEDIEMDVNDSVTLKASEIFGTGDNISKFEIENTSIITAEITGEGVFGVFEEDAIVIKSLNIEGTTSISIETKEWYTTSGGGLTWKPVTVIYTVKVIDEEFRESIEVNRKDVLENEYKKDISEVEATGSARRDYLYSILSNDKKNGNTELWDKFVSETTPEERIIWQKSIGLLRDETNGIGDVKKALEAQVQLDQNKITEEERNEVLNNARRNDTKCT